LFLRRGYGQKNATVAHFRKKANIIVLTVFSRKEI